jgi:hypothetical protein
MSGQNLTKWPLLYIADPISSALPRGSTSACFRTDSFSPMRWGVFAVLCQVACGLQEFLHYKHEGGNAEEQEGERREGFLDTGAASSMPARTDSVKRGRFISFSILAINFFLLSEFVGFILPRYIGILRRFCTL